MIKSLLKKFYYRLRSNYTTEDLVGMGLQVGTNFNRMHDVLLDPSHCWLIEIGDNVTIAPRVHVLAHDASTKIFLGVTRIGKVIIGNNVFIGADSVILPDVVIGNNVVIGANSTVSRNIPDNCVAAGSPAKVICSLEEYLEKNRKMMRLENVFGEDFTLRASVTAAKKKEMKEILAKGAGFIS